MEDLLKKGLKFLAYGAVIAVGVVLAFFFSYQNKENAVSESNFVPTAHADVPGGTGDGIDVDIVSDGGDSDGDDGSDGDG